MSVLKQTLLEKPSLQDSWDGCMCVVTTGDALLPQESGEIDLSLAAYGPDATAAAA